MTFDDWRETRNKALRTLDIEMIRMTSPPDTEDYVLLLLLIVGPWYRVYLNWRGRT